jgi:hypothetical protein
MEGEWFALHGIAYDNVFVDGRRLAQHPIYRKFICHPVDLVGEAPMNPIMVVVRPIKKMFAFNSFEKDQTHILHNSGLWCQERLKFNNHQTWVGVWRTLPWFRLRGMKHGAIDFYRIVIVIMIITIIIILDHKKPSMHLLNSYFTTWSYSFLFRTILMCCYKQ